jgi:hypothetical protein
MRRRAQRAQGLTRSFLQAALVWLVLGEISTVFLNARWFLYKAGWEGTRAYTVNGLLLVLAFFVFRVVLFGAGLWQLFTSLSPFVAEADTALLRAVPFVLLAAYGLNLYWFSILASKALAVLTGERGVGRDNSSKRGKKKPRGGGSDGEDGGGAPSSGADTDAEAEAAARKER